MILASCAYEVKFHDWDSSNCYGTYKSKVKAAFSDISWSCEGTYLGTVQSTGKTSILRPRFNPSFMNEPFVTEGESINVGCVKSVQFSMTENNLIALGTSRGDVIHYNLASKYSTIVVDNIPGIVHYINYAAGDSYLAVACSNGQIFIVQVGVGISESYFVPQSECITALTTHPTIPKYMAGGSNKGVIAVWDVNSSFLVMQNTKPDAKILDIAFSPADNIFTAIGSDQKIGIYDMRIGECVHEKPFDIPLTAFAYSPRGNDIAVGSGQGHIMVMDTRYLRSSKSVIKAHDQSVNKMRFQQERLNHFHCNKSSIASTCSLFQEPERERILPGVKSDMLIYQAGDVRDTLPFMESASNVRMGHTSPGRSTGSSPPPGQLQSDNTGLPTPTQKAVGEMSMFHIIDERALQEIKCKVLQNTKDLIDQVVDQVNNDFLKMRMNVSREFCNMELRNKDRWQEFNDTLMMIAGLDDRRLDEEFRMGVMHEAAVRDTNSHKHVRKIIKPPPDDDSDLSEDITFDENLPAYSDHILEQQEITLDEIDYHENDVPEVSMKETVMRATTSMASGFPPPRPSTSRQHEEIKLPSPKRYVSRLPKAESPRRHQINLKMTSSNMPNI
ncbi:uncharacterized protein [Atheta coriaria]|uniref:uncharacterized protein n=1 Tax=Dalotia coriaria TaxID=877792 RepID=UPI0031F38CD7